MSEWRAEIRGAHQDLGPLAEVFRNHDPSIVLEDGAYYLHSGNWDLLDEADEIKRRAVKLVELLNGAASHELGAIGPFTSGQVIRIDSDGRKHAFTFGALATTLISVKLRATATTHSASGDPLSVGKVEHSIIRTLRLSATIPEVAAALRFSQQGDWIGLYKAYEIVRDHTHGENALIQLGWVTKQSLSLFTQTAQSMEAIGDAARHASRKYLPPNQPMSTSDARTLIHAIVQRWLASL